MFHVRITRDDGRVITEFVQCDFAPRVKIYVNADGSLDTGKDRIFRPPFTIEVVMIPAKSEAQMMALIEETK